MRIESGIDHVHTWMWCPKILEAAANGEAEPLDKDFD